jgi:hypothetical protein
MAYVTPTTRADGYVVDAAEWNKNTVDNPIAIKTGTVTLDLVTSAGLVDISGAAAGQIKFPATQNASSNLNTLDDYEEGDWTPAIGGSGGQSGQAYTSQAGFYVKVGRLVHAQFSVVLSTLGTITSVVQISGLPFTSDATAGANASLSVGSFSNLTTSVVWLSGVMLPNTTVVQLRALTAAGTSAATLAQADLSNTTTIVGSITYRANA